MAESREGLPMADLGAERGKTQTRVGKRGAGLNGIAWRDVPRWCLAGEALKTQAPSFDGACVFLYQGYLSGAGYQAVTIRVLIPRVINRTAQPIRMLLRGNLSAPSLPSSTTGTFASIMPMVVPAMT